MGFIYDQFYSKATELWKAAHQLDKPTTDKLSWTFGFVKGRMDLVDLETHAIVLISSIIINEPMVPKIICAWDSPISFHRHAKDRLPFYPTRLLQLCDGYDPKYLSKRELPFPLFCLKTRYADIHRSTLSVNSWPYSLGLGYRAKYLGIRYSTSEWSVISDVDMLNLDACTPYLLANIDCDPSAFCWSTYYGPDEWGNPAMNVGLCVYNTAKYNNIFLPRLNSIYWKCHRQDSRFVPTVHREFPDQAENLRVRILDKSIVNAEKFAPCRKVGPTWVEGRTANYHAWKGEIARNKDGFGKFYGGVLDQLIAKAKRPA